MGPHTSAPFTTRNRLPPLTPSQPHRPPSSPARPASPLRPVSPANPNALATGLGLGLSPSIRASPPRSRRLVGTAFEAPPSPGHSGHPRSVRTPQLRHPRAPRGPLPPLRNPKNPRLAPEPAPAPAPAAPTAGMPQPMHLPPPPGSRARSPSRQRSAAITVEDFIAQVRGRTDALDFIYCSPQRGAASSTNPYEMDVVDPGRVQSSDYYTLSAQGVTHFANGVADFTALSQWERERSLYAQVMGIPMFRRYRVWKTFAAWSSFARKKRIKKAHTFLRGHLFALDEKLSPALLFVRRKCLEFHHAEMYRTDEQTASLEEFRRSQEEQLATFSQNLQLFAESVEQTVASACEEVVARNSMENDQQATGRAAETALTMRPQSRSAVRSAFSKTRGRSRSPSPMRGLHRDPKSAAEAQGVTYTIRAATATTHRFIMQFVRMVDYMLMDVLHRLTITATRQLDASLHQCDAARVPVLPSTPALLEFVDTILQREADEEAEREAKRLGKTLLKGRRTPTGPSARGLSIAVPASDSNGEPLSGPRSAALIRSAAELKTAISSLPAPTFPQTPPQAVPSEGDAEPLMEVDCPDPLFSTELRLTTTGMCLKPDHVEFERALMHAIRQFVRHVSSLRRLSQSDVFREYRRTVAESEEQRLQTDDPSANDEMSALLESRFTDDRDFTKLRHEIRSTINVAFQAVQAHSEHFAPFHRMLTENQELRIAEIEAEDPGLRYYEDAMRKLLAQIQDIQGLPPSFDVGVVRVDVHALVEHLLPVCRRCLAEFHDMLPRLAAAKRDKLFSEMRETERTLSVRATTVEHYARYLDDLHAALDDQDATTRRFDEVDALYRLMRTYEVEVPKRDLADFQGLQEAQSSLRSILARAETSQDDEIARYNEMLNSQITKLRAELQERKEQAADPILLQDTENIDPIRKQATLLLEEMDELKRKAEAYTRYQELFKTPAENWSDLEDAYEIVRAKQRLWQSLHDFQVLTETWSSGQFKSLPADEISHKVNQYVSTCNHLVEVLEPNNVVPKLKRMVDEFRNVLPIVQYLRNPALGDRHWEKIDKIMGSPINQDDPQFTLGWLLENKALAHKEEIQLVSEAATQEAVLQEMFEKVKESWRETEFIILPHREGSLILGSVDDILQLLEDSQVQISGIRGSLHVEPIRDQVDDWDRRLTTFDNTLTEWLSFQIKWIGLEKIFSGGELSRQLSTEDAIFREANKFWIELMRKTANHRLALRAGTEHGLAAKLEKNNKALDDIQRKIDNYLDSKRAIFPRFYFLPNEDLLEILSDGRNPLAVQAHLQKLFDSIKALEFTGDDERSLEIVAMVSAENENVPFREEAIKPRGKQVEQWLEQVETAMVTNLRSLLRDAVSDYARQPRSEWILSHKAQIVLAGAQIFWAQEAENCFRADNPLRQLRIMFQRLGRQREEMTRLVRGPLTDLERGSLCALIVIDVHNRDIIEELIKDQITSAEDFDWSKRLRYYWDHEIDDCVIRQTNTHFLYGYEYLGCTPRLVITPLTDQCYLTLTSALHLHLGGAPAGPAGTGKTETCKDLSKALARQCVVFNCSEGLQVDTMGQMFSGMAQAGAWFCFDEFNRIDIEVLSVVAQQIREIQNALAEKATTFLFQGTEIKLNPNCACFITMNPGYAGRTELPDNLKSLFRPVAMMIPNYELIAEIILTSEGFNSAKSLSRKMRLLYKLSSEQLSQQKHYDFGMRAVKSVLVMAGKLKRDNPQVQEDLLLIRSMCDSNIPKFLAEDVPLFKAIVSDLFPDAVLPESDYTELEGAIHHVLAERKLQPVPAQMLKLMQFYETLSVRHGVMLVGPTSGGKTVIRDVLSGAVTHLRKEGSPNALFQEVTQYCFNPKSITMDELYGYYNEATQEWQEGLLSAFVREAVSDSTPTKKWIIFDGPVDTKWVESLNTVLDDSKTLCLPNRKRIKLTPQVTCLFEVENLDVASPATVSRCGMVYVSPEDLPWQAYVQSWVAALPEHITEAHRQFLLERFEATVRPMLAVLASGSYGEDIPVAPLARIKNACNLLSCLLTAECLEGQPQEEQKTKLIALMFLFAFVWGMGGALRVSSRDEFDHEIRQIFDGAPIPSLDTVFDYRIDFDRVELVHWKQSIPEYTYDPELPFFDIIVPTIDTVRYSYLFDLLLDARVPTLLTGETGVGKSIIAADLLAKTTESKSRLPLVLNFSAQTSSNRTQQIIEGKLHKRRAGFSAPPGKTVILFIDDLNMPSPDEYGSQPPLELIRQMIGTGGWYDRRKLLFRRIDNVATCAACGPPGGGRNRVSSRLLSQFTQFCIPQPNRKMMHRIFDTILCGYLDRFLPVIRDLAQDLVRASVDVYERTCADFRPTPAKSHYIYNLRDLSKVIQGLLQVRPSTLQNEDQMFRLWCHECMRVFHDRLICDEDKRAFTDLLLEMLKKHFKITWEHEQVFGEQAMPIIMGDFLHPGSEARPYEEVRDLGQLNKTLRMYLNEYNMEVGPGKEQRLVFFNHAMQHVSRISRIIRQPRGNALLVGVGGCGKQSLTRLAAFMSRYQTFEISLTNNYGTVMFHEDLKKLYHIAGVEGQPVVFLFTDNQIAQESFLEDINGILNSGEVPNLFAPEERDAIIQEIRQRAGRETKLPDRPDQLLHYFIQRVRDNLHIVLCMSPVGDSFRRRCRMFPSLVNCCTIDWVTTWPESALRSVASSYFGEGGRVDKDLIERVSEMCVRIHTSVEAKAEQFYREMRRRYYTTPTSYLELMGLFLQLLDETKEKLNAKIDRFQGGVDKLIETNEKVDAMKVELKELEPTLKERSEANKVLLQQLQKDQASTDKIRERVSEEESVVRKQTEETEEMARQCQAELDVVLPQFRAAQKALGDLNRNSVSEIRTFTNPPEGVKLVMEAVCILTGRKPDWATARSLLSQANFLNMLIQYDTSAITEAVTRKLQPYLTDAKFTPTEVAKVSLAASNICSWVVAIENFARVSKVIEPRQRALHNAQEQLKANQAQLATKQAQLNEVMEKLAALRATYEASMSEQQQLENRILLTQQRYERSIQLTGALATEQDRWTEELDRLKGQVGFVLGDALLSAASLSYIGAFTSEYRRELVESWLESCRELEIPVSSDFSVVNVLSEAVEVRDWTTKGLPSDELSKENACLVLRGRRWPLMIDPQGQANRWIKKQVSGLRVMKSFDSKSFENCIRMGTPILLEDIGESIDPALTPLLLKQVTTSSTGRATIRLGDTDVDYNPNFRLFFTTKMANPHYLPDICIKVTLINFAVTATGLEDQLLADVVRSEKPQLEESRDKLVMSMSEYRRILIEIEDNILSLLKNSSGTELLDNPSLITALNDSKQKATEIEQQVRESIVTETQINSAREEYRPMAVRGSVLYLVVSTLPLLDSMYQYSLEYYKALFRLCMKNTPPSEDIEVRLRDLISNLTLLIYTNVTRGLFEKHRQIFSFMICAQIMQRAEALPRAEYQFFLWGSQGDVDVEASPNPDPEMITRTVWKAILGVQELSCFEGVAADLAADIAAWASFFDSPEPHLAELPGKWNDLTLFQKLIFIRVARPEKLPVALMHFVRENLGEDFTRAVPFDLEKAFQDSSNTMPIIFILSQGADPTERVQIFAEQHGYSQRLRILSLGRGRGPLAVKTLEKAKEAGDWVFLQNCHLALSWMPELEKIVLSYATDDKLHDSFRLWLSAMPSKAFPVPILQTGVKLTNEPPKGLLANLTRSFGSISEEQYEACSKPHAFKRLLYGLTFFHALIQERRRYGPLGWNKSYEFTESDFVVSRDHLKMYLDEQQEIPWKALRYVTGEMNYGGRVTDELDQRCLGAMLDRFYTPEILKDGYKFSSSEGYTVPRPGSLEHVREHISRLPATEDPEVFGMHPNAELVFQISEAQNAIGNLVSVQPRRTGGTEAESSDTTVLDRVQWIEQQIPPNLEQSEAIEGLFDYGEDGRPRSLSTVLLQEMARFNILLRVLRQSLDELRKAIGGHIVMTEQLELVYHSMLQNTVPGLWANNAYPSLKPLTSWVRDLVERVQFFRGWLVNGNPACYWLPGFSFPQGFLTGVLQTHARKHHVPIDALEFQYTVLQQPVDQMTAPEDGVCVHGLFLDGARWDEEQWELTECLPRELNSPLPALHFLPVKDYRAPPTLYSCPLYKTGARAGVLSTTGHSTNFVTEVALPTSRDPRHWILRGTALLCALSE